MDPIKEAFTKAKEDILSLQSQIEGLRDEIISIKRTLSEISLNNQVRNKFLIEEISTSNSKLPANIDKTQHLTNTDNYKSPLYGLKEQYISNSTGNDGVPTDRQTNQQTDQHIGNRGVEYSQEDQKITKKSEFYGKEDKISKLENVSNILESLDSIKKDIRSKFKHLTPQEMSVFSTIYELESKGFIVDYSLISEKLSLSESSIRDYIQKIIKKGIPILKTKENNKKVLVNIDKNLRNLATLETIQKLRDL